MCLEKENQNAKNFDLTIYDLDPEETKRIESTIEVMMQKIQKDKVSDKEIDTFIETLFFP